MHNHSSSGMYLVSNQPFDFDTGIYINMLENAQSDIYRGFFGRVKWCRELKRSGDIEDHFGAGINFIVKSHNYFGGIGCMVDCCCDVCGDKIPFKMTLELDLPDSYLVISDEIKLKVKDNKNVLKIYK